MAKSPATHGIENTDHMRWLGIIAVRWASLDDMLCAYLRAILGRNKHREAAVIYYSLGSFRMRIDLMRNLTTHCIKSNSRRNEVLDVMRRLDNLWKERNSIIHSPYAQNVSMTFDDFIRLHKLESEEEKEKIIAAIRKRARVERTTTRPRSATLYNRRHVPLNELKDHAKRVAEMGSELGPLTGSFHRKKN